MAPALYYPLFVLRSDGKRSVYSPITKTDEPNAPTDDQLDSTPDTNGVSDFYRKLPHNDPKHEDWRRKLGGMLMRELGGGTPGCHYILNDLPENFILYEHLKTITSKDGKNGKGQKPARNHAKGSNERQDAYLYGHPMGRKKRYRSPADFFPHLLWLVTDHGGDYDNCTCKHCCPEEIQFPESPKSGVKLSGPPKPEAKKEGKEHGPKNTSSLKGSTRVPANTTSSSKISGSQTTRPAAPPAPMTEPTQPAGRTPTPQSIATRPLPAMQSLEQDMDSQYNRFLYRPGELVWFNKGPAWGLGILVQREIANDAQPGTDPRRYFVQPLSHPFGHPSIKIVTEEASLRPWLAWSAPTLTHPGLATSGLSYMRVDWQGVLQGQYGRGDAEVDASILAAKSIDSTFTPFQQINDGGKDEIHYNGIFLGAEKIWRGEAVRLRQINTANPGSDILVLQAIIERTQTDPNTNSASSVVYVVGDHYNFTLVPHDRNRPIPDNPNLPTRIQEDLKYRNNISTRVNGTAGYWKLVRPFSSFSLTDIRGRWYESSILLPILRGPEFANDVNKGEILDAGLCINGRGDSSGTATRLDPKISNRRDAFGAAVPANLYISQGLDGHAEGPVQQQLEQSGAHNPDSMMTGMSQDESNLNQFIDLDPMDQDMADFSGAGGLSH